MWVCWSYVFTPTDSGYLQKPESISCYMDTLYLLICVIECSHFHTFNCVVLLVKVTIVMSPSPQIQFLFVEANVILSSFPYHIPYLLIYGSKSHYVIISGNFMFFVCGNQCRCILTHQHLCIVYAFCLHNTTLLPLQTFYFHIYTDSKVCRIIIISKAPVQSSIFIIHILESTSHWHDLNLR